MVEKQSASILNIPEKSRVVVANTPYTLVENYLCPNQVSIGVLQMLSLLRSRGNDVHFINMRSNEKHPWRRMRAGVDGDCFLETSLLGRRPDHFSEELDKLPHAPDEIWLSCFFVCDSDVLRELVDRCQKKYPSTPIRIGGKAIAVAPDIAQGIDVLPWPNRLKEADVSFPDFSVRENWNYGLFKLQIGCPNKCSFCVGAMDEYRVLPVDFVLSYMKEQYRLWRPSQFWNWDDNILTAGASFEEFLEAYRASGIEAELKFEMGLQPDLVNEDIIKKMVDAGVSTASLPMEAAGSKTIVKYHKPYSIISSIKMLDITRRFGMRMRNCQCTFIIGHPDDDIASIFRTYISILRFGGSPCPFPVFLFPGTTDHRRYRDIIQGKSLAELHGQLWPLIRSVHVPIYRILFRVLSCRTLTLAREKLSLLPSNLQKVFLDELHVNERFVEMCLSSSDSVKNLTAIEEKLGLKRVRLGLN
jgi:hypothetical protein